MQHFNKLIFHPFILESHWEMLHTKFAVNKKKKDINIMKQWKFVRARKYLKKGL